MSASDGISGRSISQGGYGDFSLAVQDFLSSSYFFLSLVLLYAFFYLIYIFCRPESGEDLRESSSS